MELYKLSNQDDAINMLQQMKKQGKNKKPIVFTIDFDNETESKKPAGFKVYRLYVKPNTKTCRYNNKFYCVRR